MTIAAAVLAAWRASARQNRSTASPAPHGAGVARFSCLQPPDERSTSAAGGRPAAAAAAITSTIALPTTAASAYAHTSRTCSGRLIPKPSAIGQTTSDRAAAPRGRRRRRDRRRACRSRPGAKSHTETRGRRAAASASRHRRGRRTHEKDLVQAARAPTPLASAPILRSADPAAARRRRLPRPRDRRTPPVPIRRTGLT